MNKQTSTRDRVLEFIKRNGPVSVKALTDEIGITPMAIRGHLSKLEKEEFIRVDQVRQKLGRPLQVFSLTEKGEDFFPKNYDGFALELIEDLKNLDGGKTLEKVVHLREERMIQTLADALKGCKNPAEKMEAYCRFITEQGNMPQLTDQGDNSFLLNVANCAVHTIASQFSFPCETEMRILKSVFAEAKVRRVQTLMDESQTCAYLFEF